MKYLLLFPIKLYWLIVPENKKRICLFSTSCSHYVFDEANRKGFIAGWKGLQYRLNSCNAKHELLFLEQENSYIMKLSNGDILQQNEISPRLIKMFNGMECC